MITLNYTITEQEYKDFFYYVGWLAPDKKKYRIRYQLTSLLWYLAVFILIFSVTKTLPFGIPGLIVILAMAVPLYYYNIYRVKRHFYNSGKKIYDNSDKENSEMIIGETGITVKDKSAEANYKWPAFTKKYERSEAYYLYMSSSLALIIPKRVFASAAQRESFEKMLAQYLSLQADLPSVNK